MRERGENVSKNPSLNLRYLFGKTSQLQCYNTMSTLIYNVITQCLHLQCRHFFYLKIINCYVAITTLC